MIISWIPFFFSYCFKVKKQTKSNFTSDRLGSNLKLFADFPFPILIITDRRKLKWCFDWIAAPSLIITNRFLVYRLICGRIFCLIKDSTISIWWHPPYRNRKRTLDVNFLRFLFFFLNWHFLKNLRSLFPSSDSVLRIQPYTF